MFNLESIIETRIKNLAGKIAMEENLHPSQVKIVITLTEQEEVRAYALNDKKFIRYVKLKEV